MARKIAVVSGKGGTGKTTLAAGISLNMGTLFQKSLYISLNPRDYAAEMFMGIGESSVGNLTDILNGDTELSNAVKVVHNNTACIMPPDRPLTKSDETRFLDIIDGLSGVYDYIIIDAPPGIGYEYGLALDIADEAIAVVLPEEPSIRAAAEIFGDLRRKNIPAKIVINRLRSHRTLPDVDVDEIIDRLSAELLGILPNYRLLLSKDENLFLNDESALSQIMQKIARRLCGEYVKLSIPPDY